MPFLLPAVVKELFGFHQKTFDVTSKRQAEKDRRKTVRFLMPYLILILFTLVSLALILYRSYMEAAYHYVLLIIYLLINGYYLVTACRIVVGSASNVEGALFDIQEAMQYKDRSSEGFVNIRSLAMGENVITTGTYDDKWTEGIIRISLDDPDQPYLEIPVVYEKNGVWKINSLAANLDNYYEYIYHIFNKTNFR